MEMYIGFFTMLRNIRMIIFFISGLKMAFVFGKEKRGSGVAILSKLVHFLLF